MVRNKLLRSNNPGSVMALVLFAIILLLLSGIGVLSLGQNTRIFSIRTAGEITARSAADDGITKALWQMNAYLKDDWSKCALPYYENGTVLPNCNGATYSYVFAKASYVYYGGTLQDEYKGLIDFVTKAYPTPPPGGGDYVVESIGTYNGAVKVIYATLRLRGAGDECVITRYTLTLKADTIVDGRDSRYPDDLTIDVLTEIGTTSKLKDTVTLFPGVTVDGNILVGVDGVPEDIPGTEGVIDIKPGVTVTGDKYPMVEEVEFPYIYPPVFTGPDTALKAKGTDLVINASWNGRYSMIDLQNQGQGVDRPARLIVESGDVVLHLTNTGPGKPSIDLGAGCEIQIKPGATLNLYVDGNIDAGNSMGFNNLGTPPSLKLWGNWTKDTPTTEPCQKWVLKAKGEYLGQVYAPAAAVTVDNGSELWGAFTSYSFEMMHGGNLYYDGALREVDPTKDPLVRFVLKRWYEQ